MKIYAATDVPKIDITGLKNSVFYLFNYVAEQKHVRSSRLKVTKMKISNAGNNRSPKYHLDVEYDFMGYKGRVTLYDVPYKQEIPENHWINSYSCETLLDQINPPSETRTKVEEAYEKFRSEIKSRINEVLDASGNSGLFTINATGCENLNELNFSNLWRVSFEAIIGSINTPGYTWTSQGHTRWTISKDGTDVSETSWISDIHVSYDVASDKILYNELNNDIRRVVQRIDKYKGAVDEIAETISVENIIKADIESKFPGVIIEFHQSRNSCSTRRSQYKLTVDGIPYTYRGNTWLDTSGYYLYRRDIADAEADISKKITNFRAKIAAEERKKAREAQAQRPQYEDWELNPTIYEDTGYLESGEE